jgi:phosphotransferase family enzyme
MNTAHLPLSKYDSRPIDLVRMLGRSTRLCASYGFDKLCLGKAVSKSDIPWNFHAVTSDWFTDVLCREVAGARVEIVNFGIGHDGTSGRQRYLLSYNHAGQTAGLPTSIFAKGTPTITTRISMTCVPSMQIENQFYNMIRPELNIEAPVGYHSAYDLASGRSIHLLEDLVSTKGATFPQVDTVINLEQARSMVDVLSDLHAPYYENPRLNQDLSGIMTWSENLRRMCRLMNMKKYHYRGMDKARPVLPASVADRFYDTWPAIIRSAELQFKGPQTLAHVDVHLGNWYMLEGNRMGLLDWQCLNKAHWSHDFAYAVCALLTVENRRDWEEELMKLYLRHMNEKNNIDIPFDEGWLSYRQRIFDGLALWTPTYSPPFFAPDNMQPEDLSLELIRRFTAAIDDLDSFSSLE